MKPRAYQHVNFREHKRSDTGQMSYLVEWRPERGVLRRLRFGDRSEAVAQADHIEKLYSHGLRSVAEMPIDKLIGINLMLQHIPNVPVHEIIHFYLQTHGVNGAANITIEDAGNQFIESRSDPENYSSVYTKDVQQHISRLIAKFGKRYVSTIKIEDLENYVAADVGGAPKTRRNHITTLSSFGHWMRVKKKWLPFPIPTAFEEVERPKCLKKNKELFTPEELTRLLIFTPFSMLPFISLGAFSGMRAAERMRLRPEHWQPDNDQFELTSDITKTQRRRIVGALPNLKKWIALAGHINQDQSPHLKTSAIAKAAGVPWKRNALRSSFVSYHLQKYQNEAMTAMTAGHSVSEMNASYKGLAGVNDRSAEEWFSITPEAVIKFAADNGLPEPQWVG